MKERAQEGAKQRNRTILGARTILIDAGLIDAGLGADPNLHLPPAGQLAKRPKAAGVDLTSVTDLGLTHMLLAYPRNRIHE